MKTDSAAGTDPPPGALRTLGDETSRIVRIERTVEETIAHFVAPEEVHHVDWLESRRKKQLATAKDIEVFHGFQFTDRLLHSGITFRTAIVDCAAKTYKSVHYDHGNGVAIADVDGDGRYDIYFTTQIGSNELWRNLGDGKFENITKTAGVGVADRVSVTASFADIDNDGDADLYVTTVRQGNVMFLNDGAGRFKDISASSGLGYRGHSSGAVFFDYNRDGLLDLFVTNVGKYTTDVLAPATAAKDGQEYYVGFLDGFSGHLKADRTEASILFENLGENRFADVSEETELVDTIWSGDASAVDVNEDGWPDLYVLNMQGNDEYYENEQGKRFVRKSRKVFPKTPWGSMGIKAFDYDNDGDMDIYVTDMHSDMSRLEAPPDEKRKADMQFPEQFLRTAGASIFGNAFYRNAGDGTFSEISDENGTENYWPWGLSVGDLNADGYDDVFVASSMNYPFRYGVNSVLLNNRGKDFKDSEFILGVEPRRDGRTAQRVFTVECGSDTFAGEMVPTLERVCDGRSGTYEIWGRLGTRSSVIFDIDGDGDMDIVTNEFNSEPMVLVSNLTDKKSIHFIKIRLVGTASNRDGLGARVTVHTKDGTYTKVYDGQSGYLSHSLYPMYFGIDAAGAIEKIEVVWPSGKKQVITENIPINDVLTVTEAE